MCQANRSRFFKRVPVLVPDAPLTFLRELPSHDTVQVAIHPNLDVIVTAAGGGATMLTGHYHHGAVDWAVPAKAHARDRAILAADVHSLLHVFEARLIEPQRWTSVPAALEAL